MHDAAVSRPCSAPAKGHPHDDVDEHPAGYIEADDADEDFD